jgi:sugar phosphate isomerase/epimerase
MAAPVALQLYTVRTDMEKDVEGTLAQVAEMGYRGVELAGLHGRSAAQLRQTLDGLGLQVAGAHIPLNALQEKTEQTLDDMETVGSKFVSLPWLPPEMRNSRESFERLGEQLNAVGATCKARGITLCYHNHDFEFQKFDGEYALDLLYAHTDPSLLQAELDTYWIQYAGLDPVAYVRQYADRAPLIHLKDMTDDGSRFFAEVGTGTLPVDAIIAAATGAKWLIVEQDQSRRTPLESVRISIDNLKAKGYA